MKRFAKRMLAGTLWTCMGRRNVVRLGQFLSNEGRLDVINNIDPNGERPVHDVLCKSWHSSRTDPIILDVGAHVGNWTIGILDCCRRHGVANPRIYAFEACHGTREMLSRSLASAGVADGVEIVSKAVSDHVGVANFNIVGAGAGTNSLVRQDGLHATSVEQVELTTLDEFCQQTGITGEVAFLKIDTEGHDLSVLRGASQMLQQHQVQALQFEYNHRWIHARAFLRDAFELLQPMGYRVGKITPRGVEFYDAWHKELESFREGNYLGVLPSLEPLLPRIEWWNRA